MHSGGYNPDEYEDLPVSQEVQDLFQCIIQYKPEVLQLDTPLKPFIPDFVPAIGDIDEFIKVNLQFIILVCSRHIPTEPPHADAQQCLTCLHCSSLSVVT